ncbi:toll/interleukin-1 receptor domain-containing protein [Citrobacter sp. Cb127]|uniref:toll/interleukin-1 receptor domain-containing protein n=1 Tax=Citrobacter sp. Cb127 TaxID=2985032 RepID=UPI002579DACA|nr:toll/interleukin-1 receptor domain-containing protein [Citrobacter sp. Cb127]MDM3334454.1 toll/interleukin-1 receptor domain-containing protein [Citrobacter sp. Cb127]
MAESAYEALRNELEKHLSPLKRMGKITTWHDRRIVPGQEFEHQIDHYFSQADIILLLISSDFIASDYCYQVEMTNALERHKRGDAVVIPVILRECAWHQLPFGSIMAATIDGKPITRFASHDEGYVQVVNAVSRAITNLETKKPQHIVHAPAPANPMLQATDTVFTPRSSNLSLPKSCKRAARTVLTGMCYSFGNATRQGSSSLTRFIGQSAITSSTWRR